MHILMTSLHVTDPLAAFRVYTEAFGFRQLQFAPEYQLAIVVSPEEPATGLMLEPSDDPVAAQYREHIYGLGLPALVLGSTDLAADVERARAYGLRVVQEPTEAQGQLAALIDDSVGNLIQLHQPPAATD